VDDGDDEDDDDDGDNILIYLCAYPAAYRSVIK
jgi:hypothetical protein